MLSIFTKHIVNLLEMLIFGCTQTANIFSNLILKDNRLIHTESSEAWKWNRFKFTAKQCILYVVLLKKKKKKKIQGYLHVILHAEYIAYVVKYLAP